MTSWQLVRIFAGLFILVSLALGIPGSPLFVSQWWLALTVFVGANLLQCGMTRWCLLERLLRALGARAGCARRQLSMRAMHGVRAPAPRRLRPGMRAPAALVSLLLALWLRPVAAVGLLESWRAAQQHDPEFAAARAAHEAGQARRSQAASLWRPSVQLRATAGSMTTDTAIEGARFSAPAFGQSDAVAFSTSVVGGTTERWAVSAKQPLLSGERRAQSRQLEGAADMAEREWQGAQQSLILRTAQHYFDVAVTGESLRVLRNQQEAVDAALREVRDRFQLGDVPVTDTFEAGARSEAIKAQVLALETQLQLEQVTFSDLTGLPPQFMQFRQPTRATAQAPRRALDRWLADAAASNPKLHAQIARAEVARQKALEFSAAAAPALDLVAEASRDRLSGSGDFGSASNTVKNQMIGVQLTVPLYTGGYRSARHEETLRLADQARSETDRSRQQTALQTRQAWLGITVGAGRIAALAETLTASRARLDATRLAHDIGDRTTLELLNAENDAANAEIALLQARIGALMDRLRLSAMAGQLDETVLQAIDASLQAPDGRPPSVTTRAALRPAPQTRRTAKTRLAAHRERRR